MKTAAFWELTSTIDTCVSAEELIGDMPLSSSCCGVDNNLTADGHNKVDTRSRGCSHLLALSAWRRRIIYSDQFLMGGPSAARRQDIGVVSLKHQSPSTASSPLQRTSPESGFRGGVYRENMMAQQSSSDVSSDLNEWSHSGAMRKPEK